MAKTSDTTHTHNHSHDDHEGHNHQPSEMQKLIGDNTKITITIPWKDAEPAYNQAKKKVAKTVKADGFRKGKVPAELAEKLAGTDKILDEALQIVLSKKLIKKLPKLKKSRVRLKKTKRQRQPKVSNHQLKI